MRKVFNTIILATSTVALASCGGGSVDLAKELNSSYAHDGKTIEISGKLTTPMMVWGSENRTSIEMIMHTEAALNNTNTEMIQNIMVNYGADKNSAVINVAPDAKEFKQSDIAIYDKDGNKLTTSDKVKITGKVTYTAKGPKKETANKIKVPSYKPESEDKNKDNNDYSFKITDVVIEKI